MEKVVEYHFSDLENHPEKSQNQRKGLKNIDPIGASQMAQTVKNQSAMQETWV